MATTRIMPLHCGKGRSVGKAISDIIDYVKNPEKTDHGRLITSYQCNSQIADAEFLFAKQQYIKKTGRVRGEDDVIAYHLRQSFVPGEITPEEANRLGCELARRFTNYIQEHNIEYDELAEKVSSATARYNALAAQIKAAEKRMGEIDVLRKHIINYSKTRDVYVAYRKSGYSKKFYSEHESEILLHKAAKKAFDELGVSKIPTKKSLDTEYAQLLTEKKTAYGEYRQAREEMKELSIIKHNIDKLLGRQEQEKTEKAQKQQR